MNVIFIKRGTEDDQTTMVQQAKNSTRRKMMDAMIDVETLGIKPTSVILSIAVTVFDPHVVDTFDDLLVKKTAYVVIDQKNVVISDESFTVCGSTLAWWLNRTPELMTMQAGVGKHNLRDALDDIMTIIHAAKVERVWANAPSFDLAIIKHACALTTIEPAWKYYQERDLRTVLDLAGIDKREMIEKGFIAHRADHDTAFQALLVQRAIANLATRGDPTL